MGRHLPSELSEVGWRIFDRMRALGLQPLEVAAAAGLSPSTVYRAMRADRARTSEPRLHTKRRLARALKTTIGDLFDDEQLEFMEQSMGVHDEPEAFGRLVVHHLRTLPPIIRNEAGRAAALALIDWLLTVVGAMHGGAEVELGDSTNQIEGVLLLLLHRLPPDKRRAAAKAAIEAMLQIEAISNRTPSEKMYRAINRTNWSKKRIARDRPPLSEAHQS
ncbi:MAG TPA: helix-turn-helix transcriptional regulator [Longimicrobium sp.]